MLVGLLEPEAAILDDSPREPAEGDIKLLFEEARQRRRRRILLAGLSLCVALSLVLTFFAVGGAGHFFGGPPSLSSSRGASGGQVTHQPLHAGQRPNATGPAICNKGIVAQVPRNTKASASLLPCYKLNLQGGIRTFP